MHELDQEIERLIHVLKEQQKEDGSWGYPFETGIITDAYMIILLRSLKIDDEEELIKALVKRIERKQEENGAWKLYKDEQGDGNLSLTIEAYYALLYSGYRNEHNPAILAARKFIYENGGLKKAGMYTKIMLATTGQYSWPAFFPIPIETVLLPASFPINKFDISVFGRANLVPILLLANAKYQRKTVLSPNLQSLNFRTNNDDDWEEFQSREWQICYSSLKNAFNSILELPAQLHKKALNRAESFMLERREPDGTLYSYFSSTFYMIFALLALGYAKNDQIIEKAVNGLKNMACRIDDDIHMQYTTASVWNTSLISYTLQEAGLPHQDESVRRANRYLLSRQHHKYGDWQIHNPNGAPGGWGFSDVNTINPDVDDTTASLRALYESTKRDETARNSWQKGLDWTLTMQNDDGGWAAFERNVDKKLLHLLPIQGAEFILTDPSSPDLTGRTLEFLGRYVSLANPKHTIGRTINWLLNNQRHDGAWYGRWGICYIYGTWAAVTGLTSAGVPNGHQAIKKAERWLISIQNEDGGWGESCNSDIHKKYVPLGTSTLIHTAWAADALLSISEEETPEIKKAIAYLVSEGTKQDWTIDYPTGQGMASFFYIHYHSYRYIWPLLTLSRYRKKFMSTLS
ncbi:squalene--hopene cyclase [Bacillus canaveralius]|uniref:Squalene--hopene cyclase n=1 Tax=Bacillus canaveralius TaxID=1403243 RepID=A0A2N5GGY4_9BACI|nr:squalene--hopene cyclase [Bacillus canaveralius]PLR80029.1 squalene--hopene cyclase [Bacillus canaveralius]PLR94941.1 squalene--hopene cyclase [Bacillus canaveralius]